jgi:hypothetical protein
MGINSDDFIIFWIVILFIILFFNITYNYEKKNEEISDNKRIITEANNVIKTSKHIIKTIDEMIEKNKYETKTFDLKANEIIEYEYSYLQSDNFVHIGIIGNENNDDKNLDFHYKKLIVTKDTDNLNINHLDTDNLNINHLDTDNVNTNHLDTDNVNTDFCEIKDDFINYDYLCDLGTIINVKHYNISKKIVIKINPKETCIGVIHIKFY